MTNRLIFINLLFYFIYFPKSLGQESIERDGYCSYIGTNDSLQRIIIYDPDKFSTDAVDLILKYTGISKNFIVKSSDIPNAQAIIKGEMRYVVYNQAFIQNITEQTNTFWANVSIMAHELGHHLNGHTLSMGGSRPKLELEADKYSGFILQKMGASMSETLSAMKIVASKFATLTHPAKNERMIAISNGWLEGKKLPKVIMLSKNKAKRPALINDFNEKKTVIGSKSNLAFNADAKKVVDILKTDIVIVALIDDTSSDEIYYVSNTNEIFDYNELKQLVLMGKIDDTDHEKFEYKYRFQHEFYYVNKDAILFKKEEDGSFVVVGEVFKF